MGDGVRFCAIVLAGGDARRMGGIDKTAIDVGGRSLLERALDAVAAATPIIVVGPRRAVSRQVRWAREDPPGSGPLAGLAEGIARLPVTSGTVAVLAGDLSGVDAATVDRLRAACASDLDGALLVDATGRRQWLIGVWWLATLRRSVPDEPAGRSLRSVLGNLEVAEVGALPGESLDVDTPQDLYRARTERPTRR